MNKLLGLELLFGDSSQPFELVDENFGTGWYEPRRYLLESTGVVKCELVDTTSSAGDWSGYFAVEDGVGGFDVVVFSQENAYPSGVGYILRTDYKPFTNVKDVNVIQKIAYEYFSDGCLDED